MIELYICVCELMSIDLIRIKTIRLLFQSSRYVS